MDCRQFLITLGNKNVGRLQRRTYTTRTYPFQELFNTKHWEQASSFSLQAVTQWGSRRTLLQSHFLLTQVLFALCESIKIAESLCHILKDPCPQEACNLATSALWKGESWATSGISVTVNGFSQSGPNSSATVTRVIEGIWVCVQCVFTVLRTRPRLPLA